MDFEEYKKYFRAQASNIISKQQIDYYIEYAALLYSNGMPIIYNVEHLSKLVGYEMNYLYAISNSSKFFYKEYRIPKRNGGVRIINEPFPSLKEIQKWISEEILNKSIDKYISPTAKAYILGRSIKDNAKFHKNKQVVLCLDIVDFFGNITYAQVYSVFRKFGYSKSISSLLSNICLLNGNLPQGSPTSPMLSNLVFTYIDFRIFEYCKENKIMYTRYADDLSFSGVFKIGKLINFVTKLLGKNNFIINDKKTRIITQSRKQKITGIVVNKKLQVDRVYRHKIRQSIYYIVKFGLESHLKKIDYRRNPISYIYQTLGKVNFILSINNADKEAIKYRKFLNNLLAQYKMQ